MHQVMIVDDEPLIREGLRTIIDWEEHGFQVATVAADALEALRKLSEAVPRLMIVDIRMPGMDGLQLLRTVREQCRPCPKFLILSGHADFEYARTALQLKVDGYLLKPIDEDDLIQYLERIRQSLQEERTEATGRWGREHAIQRLVSGEAEGMPEQADPGWLTYEIVLVRPLERGEPDASEVSRIKRRMIESFETANEGIVFSAEPYLGVMLKETMNRPSAASKVYRRISEACEGREFDATGGGTVAMLSDAGRSFERARELMKRRFLFAGGGIVTAEPELPSIPADEDSCSAPELEEKLYLALDAANAELAAEALRGLGALWLAAGASEQELKTGFTTRLSATLSKLAQSRPEAREFVQSLNSELASISSETRYELLLARLISICAKVADRLRIAGAGPDLQVQKMIELIHRNSADNLKLEALAEALGYSSSYLGKLFKSATGDYFNTYLDKVRIQKAKEMLCKGMKVYQVAEQVGYANVDYFHAKFRKYVGESPVAYRKNAAQSR
ncbi:response regulator [Cohnella sp.]|uniref:response regulator n=1 Tax=Cohnella sp. TaxID=1883426 RepID=UPI0037048576